MRESEVVGEWNSAILGDDLHAVRALIKAGYDINARDGLGYTPLLNALLRGCVDIAAELTEAGANVNVYSCQGMTPLMLASLKGYLGVTAKLLKAKANVNHQLMVDWDHPDYKELSQFEGMTALMFAVKGGCEFTVNALMYAGASADIATLNGLQAYDYVQGNQQVLFILEAHFVRKSLTMIREIVKGDGYSARLLANPTVPLYMAEIKNILANLNATPIHKIASLQQDVASVVKDVEATLESMPLSDNERQDFKNIKSILGDRALESANFTCATAPSFK